MHVTCHYPHHRPNDGIASQDGISSMRYCSQDTPTCVHDTAPDNTSLDRQCIRSCSHNSHLPWRRGRIDPYITTQMNDTHTIARRMSDENRNMMHNPQVNTQLATLESLAGHKGYDHGTLDSFPKLSLTP